MSKEFIENSNERRKIMECCKKVLVTWKEYRNDVKAYRDKVNRLRLTWN